MVSVLPHYMLIDDSGEYTIQPMIADSLAKYSADGLEKTFAGEGAAQWNGRGHFMKNDAECGATPNMDGNPITCRINRRAT